MSSFLEELGGITGGVGAEGLAFAAGFAAAHALGPAAEKIAQDAWNGAPDKRLPPEVAAEAAAENYATFDVMQAEAQHSGFDASRFAYFYDVTLTAPGEGLLLEMLRHGTISGDDFTHGLRKAKRETRWDGPLRELQTQRLTPQELALGVVRSTVADPGLLVVTLDTAGSTIPPYPQWQGDTLAEFAAGGVDEARARVMVGSVGLPMSPQQAASATFRKIINRQAFNLSILEGDIRPEYADAIFEQAREILTAHDYVEGYLRGWTTQQAMYDGTAKHGMSQADTDLLFDISGRPTSMRQVYVGLARGATYPSSYADVPEPFRDQLRQSNIRPEWAAIAYENRYSLPSAFVVRALLTDGAIDEARGEQILFHSGWPPDLAALVAQHYAAGVKAVADPHVTKAQTRLWTTMQTSYISNEAQQADLAPGFAALGIPADAQTQIVSLWETARELERKQLTPTQLKKAVNSATVNPATGAAWTHDEAVARLIGMGYSANDATTFLAL